MQHKVQRALVSVSDKTGIEDFAKSLAELGGELLSTGGTHRRLVEAGVPVTEVSAYTGFPEMMDGRVKTLHPKVHGGILALRDEASHTGAMGEHGIDGIDLVVVNLYPFEATIAKEGVTRAGVFATVARINHGCVPSCFVAWNAALGQQTVHAVRPVAPGEELTIAYIAGAESGVRSERQALLQHKWGFECRCDTCRLDGSARERSDKRQARLAEIHRGLPRWPVDEKLVAAVEEQLRLMEKEGLPAVYAKAGLLLAVVACVQRGELRAAATWVECGLECTRVALGEDSGAYRRFKGLMS